METNRKYIFITGLRRSGTTMLANFLNAQPNMTVFRDVGLFLKRLARWPYDPAESFDEQLRNVIISNAKAEALTHAQINLHVRPEDISNTFDAMKIILDPVAQNEDAFVGLKITEALALLRKLLPYQEIMGIYIRRDIRSVIHSGKNRFFDYDTDAQIALWKREVAEAEFLQKKYKNFHVVHYEDFVIGKNREELSRFLGQNIKWDIEALKDRNNTREQWLGNTSFGHVEAKQLTGIYMASVCKWGEEIQHDEDLQYADHVCRDLLDPANGGQMTYPFAKRLKFYLRHCRWTYSTALRGLIKRLGIG